MISLRFTGVPARYGKRVQLLPQVHRHKVRGQRPHDEGDKGPDRANRPQRSVVREALDEAQCRFKRVGVNLTVQPLQDVEVHLEFVLFVWAKVHQQFPGAKRKVRSHENCHAMTKGRRGAYASDSQSVSQSVSQSIEASRN